jgi:DNA-binding NarL/FixJ family response regulator
MNLAGGSSPLPETSSEGSPRRARSNGGRVLIVDEEPETLAALRSALEADGIEVIVHAALITLPPLLRSIDPDVILLDFSTELPAKTLFARGHVDPSTPVILFSGHSEGELTRLCAETGADGCLCKREEVPAIVSRVKTWIATSRAVRGR